MGKIYEETKKDIMKKERKNERKKERKKGMQEELFPNKER